jgi:hypothetical protein
MTDKPTAHEALSLLESGALVIYDRRCDWTETGIPVDVPVIIDALKLKAVVERKEDTMPRTIVVEVSKNWRAHQLPEHDDILGSLFEVVINENDSRGYSLHSWQLSRVGTSEYVNETIVAVFELREWGSDDDA